MNLALLLQQTAAPAAPNAAQLRQEIQQTVREATEAARQAAADARAQGGGGHNIVIPIPPVPPTPTGSGTVQVFTPTIPPQVETISLAFFAMIAIIIVGLPLARAIARRIDRTTPTAPAIPKEVRDQLQQISQSVDAIAIEVERISEGQRFATKMLDEKTPQDITMFTPRSTGQ
jgi:hypothetical protein